MVGETSNGKLIYSQDDSIVKKTVQIKEKKITRSGARYRH